MDQEQATMELGARVQVISLGYKKRGAVDAPTRRAAQIGSTRYVAKSADVPGNTTEAASSTSQPAVIRRREQHVDVVNPCAVVRIGRRQLG